MSVKLQNAAYLISLFTFAIFSFIDYSVIVLCGQKKLDINILVFSSMENAGAHLEKTLIFRDMVTQINVSMDITNSVQNLRLKSVLEAQIPFLFTALLGWRMQMSFSKDTAIFQLLPLI